jgi:hypothetical protein
LNSFNFDVFAVRWFYPDERAVPPPDFYKYGLSLLSKPHATGGADGRTLFDFDNYILKSNG